MNDFFPPWPALAELIGQKTSTRLRVSAGIPYLAMRLALLDQPVFVLTTESQAETYAADLSALVAHFAKPQDWSIGAILEKSVKERLALFDSAQTSRGISWFGSPAALLENNIAKEIFLNARLFCKVGRTLQHSNFIGHLCEHGYLRVPNVEEIGEFASRGEVLDFWSPNQKRPIRLVLNNDVIESMHTFDPTTQRTTTFIAETHLVPLLKRESRPANTLDYLSPQTLFIIDERSLSSSSADPAGDRAIGDLTTQSRLLWRIGVDGIDLEIKPPTTVLRNWELFKKEVESNALKNTQNWIFCRNTGEFERMQDILDELHLRKQNIIRVDICELGQGFQSPALNIAAWSFSDLTGSYRTAVHLPKFRTGRAFDSMSEIKPSDYVVHEAYGIGKYRGLRKLKLNSRTQTGTALLKENETEFLDLEYLNGDRLFVPIQDFKLVQKYAGSEGQRPKLNSLDGAGWERIKQRIRQEVAQIAAELIQVAALRATQARPQEHALTDIDYKDHMLNEFIDSFPYEETPDQTQATNSILQDMRSPNLMDRLVCGDVGYGKTEIAMRAAFKSICDGKQVAVLVPTTILAEQHYKTFQERFAAFPVRVEMLSRFQKSGAQKEVLSQAREGKLDIVIGTHRLLQKDVHFKNIGLIIVDEEHRFGVQQKESLKKLKLNSDLLYLSATPIPRTLSMAMGGLRDISLIETAPEGRLPIDTRAGVFDEDVLKEAVERELARKGQIFYVHNRIMTIEIRKRMLEKLFPQLKIGIAHGQMNAKTLEEAMWSFLHRKWDLLLSTTIIESGLDIPNVNTLIVEDTEEFGLAQLYQLRGRVGRQKQKAYCVLFFSDWSHLSGDAKKRLDAIQEFSALGSGMKLALKDLEIRGTGNLLGPQQHGVIRAVGLDLYCQLLSEEVEKLKHNSPLNASKLEEEINLNSVEADLNVSAYIPEEYVSEPGERITLYKKMLSCRNEPQLDTLRGELQDRFGPIPEEALALFKLMRLKMKASELGITTVSENAKGIVLGWQNKNGRLPILYWELAQQNPELVNILPPKTNADSSQELQILFKSDLPEDSFEKCKRFLQTAKRYVKIEKSYDNK